MLQRDFTEEQHMFRDAYRKFLASEIVPHMESWREAGIVDREAFRKAGEQGFLMIWPDEKYGGMGDSDFRFEQIIIEETAYARVGDWFNTLHSRLVGPYFTRFGSEEQCARLLPKASSMSACRSRTRANSKRSMAASRLLTARCSKKARRLAATRSRKRAGSPIQMASSGKLF